MRWRGLTGARKDLDLEVRRIGPLLPTMRGGAAGAGRWLRAPTAGVIAYNDLMAVGFVRAVREAGRRVPGDVNVVGFDNIPDAALVEPRLTTIAAPIGASARPRSTDCWTEDGEVARQVSRYCGRQSWWCVTPLHDRRSTRRDSRWRRGGVNR